MSRSSQVAPLAQAALERPLQEAPPAGEARLDRVDVRAERDRDVRDAEALHVEQLDRAAVRVGQRRDAVVQDASELEPLETPRLVRASDGRAELLGRPLDRLGRARHDAPVADVAAALVTRRIDDDGGEPVRQVLRPVQPRDGAIRIVEGDLQRVLRALDVPRLVVGDREQPPAVDAHDLRERGRVALPPGSYELGLPICGVVRGRNGAETKDAEQQLPGYSPAADPGAAPGSVRARERSAELDGEPAVA